VALRGAPAETLVDPVSERGILTRARTMAVSALAASALIFTASAADGHAGWHTRTHVASSDSSGMGWARYGGYLTDLSPTTDDVFDGAQASAVMIGIEGSSFFRLQITGIDDNAEGNEYPAHLHKGPCVAGQGASALGHYNTQEEAGLPAPWPVNSHTEVHLDFTVNSDGSARATANVPFIPLSENRSIVIHTDARAAAESSPAHLACLPLDIKPFPKAG
jgi:Cu/Zn superoxide dismutase